MKLWRRQPGPHSQKQEANHGIFCSDVGQHEEELKKMNPRGMESRRREQNFISPTAETRWIPDGAQDGRLEGNPTVLVAATEVWLEL